MGKVHQEENEEPVWHWTVTVFPESTFTLTGSLAVPLFSPYFHGAFEKWWDLPDLSESGFPLPLPSNSMGDLQAFQAQM